MARENIGEYTEAESEFYNVDKYIVLTPDNKFIYISGRQYEDLIKLMII